MKYYNRRSEADQQVIMVKQEEATFPSLGMDLGLGGSTGDPRAIWLTNEVYPDTMAPVIQQIHDINYQDSRKEKEAALDGQIYVRQPIKLYVSSYGGSVYDGFGLVGAILSSKTPVHTYANGKVMSMGFVIAVSGTKRFAYPHTTYMFHSVSSVAWGKFTELEESVEESRRLQQKIDTLTTTKTKIRQERLDEVHATKYDWYFDALDALELNCVDEIL